MNDFSTPFPINRMSALTSEHPRYDLAESFGPHQTLAELLQHVGMEGLHELELGYGTTNGLPELRQQIADIEGVQADDVTTTIGSMQALFLLSFILCRNGGEVITTSPLFPLQRGGMQAVGAHIAAVPLSFDDGFIPSADAIIDRMSARTRLVCLASPQNPSGVALPDSLFTDILIAMSKRCPDAFLLVDETYRQSAYDNAAPAPSAIRLDPRVITCAALSKCHGLPGLRAGWVVIKHEGLKQQVRLGKAHSVVSAPVLEEVLAARMLGKARRLLDARNAALSANLSTIEKWIEHMNGLVQWNRPNSGALCCARLNPEIYTEDAVEKFHTTLASHGVRVGRGEWFDQPKQVFRLGFGYPSNEDLSKALDIVGSAARDLR